MPKRVLFVLLFLLGLTACGGEPEAPTEGRSEATLGDYAGDWGGDLSVMGQTLPLVLHVEPGADDEVTLDSPAQNGFGFVSDIYGVEDGALSAEWSDLGLKIAMRLSDDGQSLAGEFSQGPIKTDLLLERLNADEAEAASVPVERAAKPQEPTRPYPYAAEDVTLVVSDGTSLSGTLTIPEGPGPFPAAVLLSGSGAQDRDESLLGHKPFLVLSDRLTRAGVMTLRFDDRGVGGSGGNYSDTAIERLADDAAEALALLRGRSDVSTGGIIGHSEGGLVAGLAAARSDDEGDPSYLVTLAGPFAPLDVTIMDQVRLAQEKLDIPQAAVDANLDLQRQILDALKAGATAEDSCDRIRTLTEPVGAFQSAEPLCDQIFFTAAKIDPAAGYATFSGPVLALFGEKDLQVLPSTHESVARTALSGNDRATVTVIPGRNHLFQRAETGELAEYGALEETMGEDVMATIADFILSGE